MANYQATARTNMFRVKDVAALTEAFDFTDQIEVVTDDAEGGIVTLLCHHDDDAGWPRMFVVEEGENEGDIEEVDLESIVAEHLAEGAVAIFYEVGKEKLRYVSGMATVVNAAGVIERVDLEKEITKKAEKLGSEVLGW